MWKLYFTQRHHYIVGICLTWSPIFSVLWPRRPKLAHANLSIKLLCNWSTTKILFTHVSEIMYSCVGEAVYWSTAVPVFLGLNEKLFWFRSCFPPQSTNCHRKVWICQKLFALCFGSSHSRMELSPHAIRCQSVCFHYSANNTLVVCQPTSTISSFKSLHLWWKKGKLIHWL